MNTIASSPGWARPAGRRWLLPGIVLVAVVAALLTFVPRQHASKDGATSSASVSVRPLEETSSVAVAGDGWEAITAAEWSVQTDS